MRRNETGASLVMAMVLLVVGSLIAVALTQYSTGNLQATSNLRTLRTVNYAADGATDGAIQQMRYHGGCEDFPKSGSLQLGGEYVYVHCVATAMPVITATQTSGSSTLTNPSAPFQSAYSLTSQPVVDSTGTIGTISEVASDGTSATMSVPATASGTVYVGEEGEVFATFTACSSSALLTSCAQPEITATVLYDNIKPGSTPTGAQGYSATVESWKVTDANA